jgi:outer membrane protein insertion porin family
MQHAVRDRARCLWSLSCALLVGVVMGRCAPIASAQPAAGDPFATAPNRQGVQLPSSPRSQSIRQTAANTSDSAESPFTLNEPLVEVKIEGNTTIPNSEIARHIKTRPGRPVTAKQIKDDVDALVRTRWFANVEPSIRRTDDGNVLVFRVLERPIVTKVEYKGNKKIKTKVFQAMTNLKAGSPYDVSANRECARRIEEHYHEKGFAFATVELERGDVRDDPDRVVVFLINEGPKVSVSAVRFEGNDHFNDGILKLKTRTKTRILWLFGGKYDPTTIADDMEGVRQYYYSLGYFDVQVKPRQEFSQDKSKIELHYEITEGKRYRIRNINVVGNQVLSEEEIRGMTKVIAGQEYNARHIAKDVDAIKSRYGEQGRLHARVDAVPEWTDDNDAAIVDVVYKIDEDKVYRVRNFDVHIAGDHPHTKTNLIRNLSPIQPGDLADPKKIYLLKRRLEGSQYFDTGPAGPRIDTSIVKNDHWIQPPDVNVARGQNFAPMPSAASGTPLGAGHSLLTDTAFSPAETPREQRRAPKPNTTEAQNVARPYFVEMQPEPEADESTPEADSARLAPLTPVFRAQSADPLKPPADFGFDNSPQGDPFGNAIRNPDPSDWERMPPPEFIDIDTYVNEARTGRLMFGVGVNSDAGVVGNIVLSEQNFDIMRPPTSWADVWNGTAWRGGGQRFRIEAMPGSQVSRYLVDWSDPYFMDTNNNLGVSGFYFQRFYTNWTEQRLGGRVRVGRQFTQRWSGALALRLEDVNIGNPSVPTPPDLAKTVGDNFLSTLRASVMHDTRDAAFLPSEGHYLEFSVEQAFNEFNYTRLEAEGRQYFTTYQRADGGGKHTVTLRGQASWSGDDTPIFERFYAGGFQTFRGFAFRGVSPIDTNVRVGGNWMLLGGAEYMLPVTANEMIKTVAFTDFGTVTDRASLDNFRLSVGAGLRITVPAMGPVPIALDFAYPILKEDFDRKQVFSFYVGINR